MSEKPILFSGEMIRAILEGRKTQTRRVIKPQPSKFGELWMWVLKNISYALPDQGELYKPALGIWEACPYGRVGDRLWVRETWNAQTQSGKWWHEVKREYRNFLNWAWTNPVQPAFDAVPDRWLPSIHMPRAASRITLEIVNVRVERIQQITDANAGAEGVNGDSDAEVYVKFQDLWDDINAQRGYGWDVNPWVWVIEFKVV